MKVDNSSLTGESVPVALRPDSSDPNHLESRNLAFYSTNVVEGKGRVIKTGDETVMGTIVGLVASLNSGFPGDNLTTFSLFQSKNALTGHMKSPVANKSIFTPAESLSSFG